MIISITTHCVIALINILGIENKSTEDFVKFI